MAMRTPRGFERNRPFYNEVCEGVRPNSQALPRKAYTGLPHVRIDEYHHDPIVIDPGTIVGMPTSGAAEGAGDFVPAVMAASGAAPVLSIFGSTEAANNWGLPGGASGALDVGTVKPMGVVYQPIYSFILETRYTNYKRTASVGIVTDYVIEVPATNEDEVLIDAGDVVCLGDGAYYGAGWSTPFDTHKKAGRYAAVKDLTGLSTTAAEAAVNVAERTVGRCLKRTLLGTSTGTANESLDTAIANGTFTVSSEALAEYAGLDKVQTVPGLSLSGSGTKGLPAWTMGALSDDSKRFFALTMLIRL